MLHPVLFVLSALAASVPATYAAAVSASASSISNLLQGSFPGSGIQSFDSDFSDELLDFSLNTRNEFDVSGLQNNFGSSLGRGFNQGISLGGVPSQGYGISGGGLSSISGSGFVNEFAYSCQEGEVLNVDGKCTQPLVSKNVFVYDAPAIEPIINPAPQVPRPKVDFNIVFVRTPESPKNLDPLVVPPPQQKTLVYVLSRNPQLEQDVIEVPAGPPQTPEVFYINYNKGDNPSLPGGVSLQEVLASLKQQEAKVINGNLGTPGGLGGSSYGDTDNLGLGNTVSKNFIRKDDSSSSEVYQASSPVSLLSRLES